MKEKKDFVSTNVSKLGFFLSPNLGVHIILSIILNTIISLAIVGITSSFDYSVFNYTFVGLIFFNVVATLLETMILIFTLRHLLVLIVKSFGVLIPILYGLIFYVTTFIIKDVSFRSSVILNVLIYTIVFLGFRLLTKIVIRRLQIRKEEKTSDI